MTSESGRRATIPVGFQRQERAGGTRPRPLDDCPLCGNPSLTIDENADWAPEEPATATCSCGSTYEVALVSTFSDSEVER